MHSQTVSLDRSQKHFIHILLWQHVNFNFLPLCTSLGKRVEVFRVLYLWKAVTGCFLISSLIKSKCLIFVCCWICLESCGLKARFLLYAIKRNKINKRKQDLLFCNWLLHNVNLQVGLYLYMYLCQLKSMCKSDLLTQQSSQTSW